VLVGIAKLAHEAPLLEAKARVDYSELPARRYFNRCTSPRVPFDWTLNPYRGCEFGCKYCYARYTHEFMEYRDGLDFERKIFAKSWDARAFRAELRKIDRRASIALGTATDPYQPAERRYLLTRRMLAEFAAETGYRLGLTTKSDLVARDVDLLRGIAARHRFSVSMTVTTVDAELARALEPMAPHPELRLRAVAALSAAGIRVGVYASPVLPGITDSEQSLTRVAEAARDHGAAAFGGHPVFLQPCAQRVFFPFLDERFPHLARGYREQFEKHAFLRGSYAQRLSERVRDIRARIGLASRPVENEPVWSDPQLTLDFDEHSSSHLPTPHPRAL
jgi:DNA repair photolyase